MLYKSGVLVLKVLKILDIKLDYDCEIFFEKVLKRRIGFVVYYGCKKIDLFVIKKKEVDLFDFFKVYLDKNKIYVFDLFKCLDFEC